jgi:hypothetical protein
MGDRLPNEGFQCGGLNICDNTGNDIPLTTDSADDWRFAGPDTASSAAAAAFIPMPILGQAADEGFIDLDNPAELPNVFHQGNADLVAHGPSGFVGTEAHVAHNLERAHALLAGQHQMNNAIPITQRLICILKNRIDQNRKPIARRTARGALSALPMPFAGRQIIDDWITTARAVNTIRPAARLQIRLTRIFVWKHSLKLSGGKLVNWLRLLAGHGDLHSMEIYCHE